MTENRLITAAIFDMDGTIFDTEQIYRRAWLSAGVPEPLYRSYIGTPRAYIKKLLTENGFDAEEIYRQKDAFTAAETAVHVPVKPGAETCLAFLKEHGIRCAIATSSSVETAQTYLAKSGLAPYFDVVCSGNQVEHGKPAPDVFLYAAELLGTAPEECFVAEDSFNGVRAGHAAGMFTVMIPDLVAPDEEILTLADACLENLAQLPDLLIEKKLVNARD